MEFASICEAETCRYRKRPITVQVAVNLGMIVNNTYLTIKGHWTLAIYIRSRSDVCLAKLKPISIYARKKCIIFRRLNRYKCIKGAPR